MKLSKVFVMKIFVFQRFFVIDIGLGKQKSKSFSLVVHNDA